MATHPDDETWEEHIKLTFFQFDADGWVSCVNKDLQDECDGWSLMNFHRIHVAVISDAWSDLRQALVETPSLANLTTLDGVHTPLTLATGNASMSALLLSFGADPNRRDTNGRTALQRAVWQNSGPEVVRLLIENKALPLDDSLLFNLCGYEHAVTYNEDDTLTELLHAGLNSRAQNDYGQTVLDLALKTHDARVIKILQTSQKWLSEEWCW